MKTKPLTFLVYRSAKVIDTFMKNSTIKIKTIVIVSLSILAIGLSGCVSKPAPAPQLTQAQLKVEAGKSHFHSGEYGSAETNFLDASIWKGGAASKIESLKYLAFIYCVTERVTLCRHSFYKALQLDPGFELTAAESTHPLWGPEFVVAQSGLNGI